MNWEQDRKKVVQHHWQMSVSFKVKDEIQFPPFYGQYNVQKGAKARGLGDDNEVIMFEAVYVK